MSYSPLVDYVKISPNSSNPRNHVIDTITIHHMAGNLTVKECGDTFASPSRQASSNYAIDNDLRVACYVDENNRAWTSSSRTNDNRAITIELANDGDASTNWHVADNVIEKCIDLCVDICKRNKIPRLNYTGDTTGNLTRHNMFASTSCPGPHLQSKLPYIVEKVNEKLTQRNEKEELSMTQYQELINKNSELQKQVDTLLTQLTTMAETITALSNQVTALQHTTTSVADYAAIRYNYVDSYMPDFAHDTIKKLIDLKILSGDLNLSYDDLRVFTLLDRLHVIDNCREYPTLEDIPEYAKDLAKRLIDAKVLRGDGDDLAITEPTLKLLCYLDRMNLLTV